MSLRMTFAEKLSTLRAEQNMGVRELGRAVGVTGMHISNLEKGKSAPSAELVMKLAEALQANVDELLYLADGVARSGRCDSPKPAGHPELPALGEKSDAGAVGDAATAG